MINKLQDSFIKYLIFGDNRDITSFLNNKKYNKNLSIYLNNFQQGLIAALKNNFPNIIKLVGEEYFNLIAKNYIKENYKTNIDLNYYGQNLGYYIANNYPHKSIFYIEDFCNFEYLFNLTMTSKENNHVINLQSYSPEQLIKLNFKKRSEVLLLKSKYNIWDLFEYINNESTSLIPQIIKKNQYYIFSKYHNKVKIRLIDKLEYDILNKQSFNLPNIMSYQLKPDEFITKYINNITLLK